MSRSHSHFEKVTGCVCVCVCACLCACVQINGSQGSGNISDNTKASVSNGSPSEVSRAGKKSGVRAG